jgi:hypothetical protein
MAVVREPLARLVSLFNFVSGSVGRLSSQLGIDIRTMAERCDQLAPSCHQLAWPSVRAFLQSKGDFDLFLRSPLLPQDRAYRTQYSMLSVDAECANDLQILRTEELHDCGPILATLVGLPVEIPWLNRSASTLLSPDDVSPSARLFIRRAFADDYRAFY